MVPLKVTARLSLLFLVLTLCGCPETGLVPPPSSVQVAALVQVPTQFRSQPWQNGPDRLIGIGDSITDGFGATNGRGYFQRLSDPADPLSLAGRWPQVESENFATSCSTSLDHWEHQLKQVPTYPKDEHGWVVITSGGNDIIHNYGRSTPEEGAMYGATLEQARPWIENYEVRLEAILTALKDRFPGGCDIFLGNIYDPTDGVGDIENAHQFLPPWEDGLEIHAAYNEVIKRVAAKHDWVHLVDIHSTFMGHGIHRKRGVDYWYFYNLGDPNDEGYEALRAIFLQRMEEVAQARGWSFSADSISTSRRHAHL